MDEELITFASGLIRYDAESHVLTSDTYHITVPEKQLQVFGPLVGQIGELVLTDELIDITHPGLSIVTERYRQQLRVQRAITGLRNNFDRLHYGLGDPKTGVILNKSGKGYSLSKDWEPLDSTGHPDN